MMRIPLKFRRGMPMERNAMDPFFRIGRILVLALLLGAGAAEAAKKKAKPASSRAPEIPLVAPAAKQDQAAAVPVPVPMPAPRAKDAGKSGTTFEELNFNRTLIIEGKVEKPAVQFTLLKEPPPEKEIRFETSFLENILKLDRENTFKAGETYGRE